MPEHKVQAHTLSLAEPQLGLQTDGRVALANSEAELLFGYSWDELLGRPLSALLTEPLTMCPGTAEVTGVRKDGTKFRAEVLMSTVDSAAGSLMWATVYDLTEVDRQARTRNLLEALIRSSLDAVVVTDPDNIITVWNPAAEALYGYTAMEIIGRSRSMMYPQGLYQAEEARFDSILGGATSELEATPRRRKDGSLVIVSSIAFPVHDAGGRIIGVAGISRPVTESRRTELIVRELFETMTFAVIGVGQDGRIQFTNVEAERQFGYPRNELVGQSVEILVPENQRLAHLAHRSEFAASPHSRRMGDVPLVHARRKDGTEFPCEVALSPIDIGEQLIVVATVADISARMHTEEEARRLEHALQVSQRMESLGQLAGGIAHNFNNLLAVILSHTGFVEEELAAAGPEPKWQGVLADVGQIRRAAERAAAQTQQLLAVGRREPARPVPLNVNDTLAGIGRVLSHTIDESIEIVTRLGANVWQISADPAQLEQILINLAVNARDAMPHGGTLTICTDNVAVPEGDPRLRAGRYVRLRVADTGTGMDAAILDRAFEPFFTTKPLGKAGGMGLSVVYGIVSGSGGDVEIESTVGSGTSVTIHLPALEGVVAAPERPAGGPPAGDEERAGNTILLVDDEPDLRDATRRLLERAGYRVLSAGNGAEAIELAGAYPGTIDMLLTDVAMPGMLGRELAHRLTDAQPSLRVLFMSGYAQALLSANGNLDPDVELLQKPFDKAALLGKVGAMLRG